MTPFFQFAAARITPYTAAGQPSDEYLDLSVHGLALVVADADAHGGERYILRLADEKLPVLPPTSERGYDLLLWDPCMPARLPRYKEAWLHRVTLSPAPPGPGYVSLAGPAWGRTFHLETEPPVPFATTAPPGLEVLTHDLPEGN
ncbi:hypothetical protein EV284_6439 [Streptomyces sp. BK022]|uniref:hypothetical protein n=1 Tax=Streptomyces sp. BK022 TaxID=2512123 RepID=UPI00102A6040|nr:hypothetical protein [Streptomyces sp. BK022]RZU28273.1 hypothetical protein EV284_6439 [Streptomyces sp. BK022]